MWSWKLYQSSNVYQNYMYNLKVGELSSHASGKKCFRCGRFPPHAFHQCPAKNIICHRCGKQGHFQSHCQTPSTDISTVSKQSGTGFVGILDAGGKDPGLSLFSFRA